MLAPQPTADEFALLSADIRKSAATFAVTVGIIVSLSFVLGRASPLPPAFAPQ